MSFGVCNNWDQIEEKERNQCENSQDRAQAKLMAIAGLAVRPCNLRTTQTGKGSLTIYLKVKSAKGKCFKCKSAGCWAQKCQKEHSLDQSQNTGHGKWYCTSLKGEGGLLLWRWPRWRSEAAQGFWQLPSMRWLSPFRRPGWSFLWQIIK